MTQPQLFLFLVSPLLVGAAGCQSFPASSSLVGTGGSSYKPISVSTLQKKWGGVAPDPAATARLAKIGGRLQGVAGCALPCVFELVNSDKPNAICLDRFVFVTRGLYEQLTSDDLVAAVLAHELAHIVADDERKPCRGRKCQLRKEIAADRRGSGYLIKAGYQPQAMAELVVILRNDQRPGWAQARMDALSAQLSYGR